MYEFFLYYEKNTNYSKRLEAIESLLKQINKKWGAKYTLKEKSSLTFNEIQKLKSDIREISPQTRGKVVSSKNYILPLSRKKNPNLTNTPILVLFKNGIAIDVHPHLLGTTYFGIESTLERMMKYGPQEYVTARGLLEDPIIKILADNPSILEDGLKFVGINVDTDVGVIDLLFQDKEERPVVVEVETSAGENSVSQVCRLAAGYSMKNNIPLSMIRKVIVCQKFEGNLNKTCQGASVELYQMVTKKMI